MSKTVSLALLFALMIYCSTVETPTDESGPQTSVPAHEGPRPLHEGITSQAEPISLSNGQLVYVPIYSHVYHIDRSRPFNLTATLSVRNTDTSLPISLRSVDYYDTQGNLVESFLEEEIVLDPLASVDYVVDEHDVRGGSGANFLVEWSAATSVTQPIVEAVMVSTRSYQGISFLTKGRVIQERKIDESTVEE